MQPPVLSKSAFMYGMQCYKRLWLHKYLPRERDKRSVGRQNLFRQGEEVGALARQLFPGGINASPQPWNAWKRSVADTMKYIRKGHQIIYEAAFLFEEIYCAIDILVKVNTKWYAFEVKSTTSVRDAHLMDAALQYYVITGAGLSLEDISIIHLNKQYIRQGELDIHKLFKPVSVLAGIGTLQNLAGRKSGEFLRLLSNDIPPDIQPGPHCEIPYPCDFQKYCNMGVSPPVQSSHDNNNARLQLKQIMEGIDYPHYYLQLDGWSHAIPLMDGHWPYRQIFFQYTLVRKEHPELAPGVSYYLNEDPHDQHFFMENLLKEAGSAGKIFVHHESFAHYMLQEAGKDLPAYSNRLSALICRLKELPAPFRKDCFFTAEQKENEIYKALQTENLSEYFVFPDLTSASAAYFHLYVKGELISRAEKVRLGLRKYAEKSILSLLE